MAETVKIDIVFWGGNVNSVAKAFDVVARKLSLSTSKEFEVRVIETPPILGDVVVFPGVGNFGAAVEILKKRNFLSPLKEHALMSARNRAGFVGICLGYQLLFASSQEAPGHEGMGVFDGEVEKFRGVPKVPHMGWNQVFYSFHSGERLKKDERLVKLWQDIPSGTYFYFVHSYRVPEGDHVVAFTDYEGVRFPSASMRGLLLGVQFHPEKSQFAGLKFIENYLRFFI